MKTNKELIKSAKRRNPDAYFQLFQQYEKQIYWTAYIQVKNEEDALDIVQETAYLSYKNINSLREESNFKSWLMRIAYHCTVDLLRKKNKVVHLHPEYEGAIPSEIDYEEDISLRLSLDQVMAYLNPMERTAITLRYYHGYKLKEISEIMDIPIGTVKTLLYRSLDQLKKKIEGGNMDEIKK